MKQHARSHTDLDAMLIGQKTVPKGCRVLNVSPQGMMLQCEPDGRLLTFRDSDLVDVHLTVQHGGGRKKFAIPSIVNRVDIKSIDVVFQHPNSELLKLIETYRTSDAHMMEASIAFSPQDAGAKISALPNKAVNTPSGGTEDTDSSQGNRRILYPVLLTVIFSVCIAAGAYLYTSGIESRLGVLETITINQTNELAEIRSRIFSSSLQEGRYASLNARLQALTDAFGTLESKLDTVISGKPVATVSGSDKGTADTIALGSSETPISITPESSASGNNADSAPVPTQTTEKPVAQNESSTAKSGHAPSPAVTVTSQRKQSDVREPELQSHMAAIPDRLEPHSSSGVGQTGPSSPGTAEGKTEDDGEPVKVAAPASSGPWIINLLSSRRKLDTDKLAELAATHGIPVVESRAIVKGKEYWRLQVTGFKNATDAKNYAIPVKKKLGIQDVWIFRQKI